MKIASGVLDGESRLLLLAGAVSFTIAAIATAPASLIAGLIERNAPQAEIAAADGTVWRGTLKGVYFNDISLGEISYKMLPARLFSGNFAADVAAKDGALIGKGRIEVGANVYAVSGLSAQFNLSSIRRFTFFGFPYGGTAEIRAEKIRVSAKGCVADGASLSTNMLDSLARKWSGEPFPLSGEVSCADGRLFINVAGANRDGALRLTASVGADLGYSLSVVADPKRAELGAILRGIGFEGGDSALSMTAAGQLKGLSS